MLYYKEDAERQPRLSHLDSLDLVLHHVRDLAVADSIPVEDDPGGKTAVDVVVLPEHLGDVGKEIVLQLLGGGRVHVGQAHVLGEGLIHGGNDGPNTPPLLSRVVVGVVADDHGVLNREDRLKVSMTTRTRTDLHRHLDCPRLSAHLAVHLQSHLGSH